jgi:hypothetical protein
MPSLTHQLSGVDNNCGLCNWPDKTRHAVRPKKIKFWTVGGRVILRRARIEMRQFTYKLRRNSAMAEKSIFLGQQTWILGQQYENRAGCVTGYSLRYVRGGIAGVPSS